MCIKVKDATGDCQGFDGVSVVIKDRFGQTLCSGTTSNGGEFCCTINSSDFPIDICTSVSCSLDTDCIDEYDLTYMQNYVLGNPYNDNYPPDFVYWADINQDGVINGVDLVELYRIIHGTSTNPPSSYCRLVSPFCKDITPPIPSNCYSGCQTINTASDLNLNFWLYMIGDANRDCEDSDCTKPFVEYPDDESFKISENGSNSFDNLDIKSINGLIEFRAKDLKKGAIEFKLFDTGGRMVFNQQNEDLGNSATHLLDVSHVSNGIYFLQIKHDKNNILILKKLVIIKP